MYASKLASKLALLLPISQMKILFLSAGEGSGNQMYQDLI
jgi:hypothetical protein